MTSDWMKLLSPKRPHDSVSKKSEAQRNQFQRDFDRIVFSSAFRRLQNKTQVHPFPTSDYVRRRLTHSLEVSCVGRSLGTRLGQRLRDQTPDIIKDRPDFVAEVGQITSTACLAHDIGNPPLGHAGEDAIATWFQEHQTEASLNELSEGEQKDFLKFEGNAQGFRLMTRLQQSRDEGGLKLTAATLAAFTKYPTPANKADKEDPYVGKKKHGYFSGDRDLFAEVANATGLIEYDSGCYRRHPLVFFVEAADDICYRIVDLEDGVKLHRISFKEAEACLVGMLADSNDYKRENDDDVNLGWLRAKAIGDLINSAGDVFEQNEEEIRTGRFWSPLLKKIPASDAIKQAALLIEERVFRWERTILTELAGAKMLTDLLDTFVGANANQKSDKSVKTLLLVPNYSSKETPYNRLLSITDYISGMTDSFLLHTHQQLQGRTLA